MRAIVLASLVLLACGARTGTSSGTNASADADGGGADAAAVCRRWSVAGPPVIVSPDGSPDDNFGLADAVATREGALVAWTRGYLADEYIALRVVRWDPSGANGAPHVLMTSDSLYPLWAKLTTDLERAGVVLGTSFGPVLVPITTNGEPLGAATPFKLERWSSLVTTSKGFEVFAGQRSGILTVDRLKLDGAGVPFDRRTIFTPAPKQELLHGGWGRSTLPDGTFLATTRTSAYLDYHIVARHFDAEGAPLGSLHNVATLDIEHDGNLSVPLVPVTNGALLAWSPETTAIGAQLFVRPLDPDGAPRGEAVLLAGPDVAGFVLTPEVSGGALVGWSTVEAIGPDAAYTPHLVAVGPSGAPASSDLVPTIAISGLRFSANIRVVTHGARGLLLFGGTTAPEEWRGWRVYAVPLACGP